VRETIADTRSHCTEAHGSVGGAIYNAGTLMLTGANTFSADVATGGDAGDGGKGGGGGGGASGGGDLSAQLHAQGPLPAGTVAFSSTTGSASLTGTVPNQSTGAIDLYYQGMFSCRGTPVQQTAAYHAGNGGNGTNGGDGGAGGRGGAAGQGDGGAIMNVGSMQSSPPSFGGDQASGGKGGAGGDGGSPGWGGLGAAGGSVVGEGSATIPGGAGGACTGFTLVQPGGWYCSSGEAGKGGQGGY
jgi:hypothetical protein